ncbi:hypothetical protein [Aquipuribacter hungaricus]|uniref:Uncharacterized protein n=1 Tax=Aquipuribacter hungaricus TaxID=545624 RepID=A0ABV7WI40_9MICO
MTPPSPTPLDLPEAVAPAADLAATTTSRRRRRPVLGALVLSAGMLLAACGGEAVEPADAETGVPLNSGEADPAASPEDSGDPLTGSSP